MLSKLSHYQLKIGCYKYILCKSHNNDKRKTCSRYIKYMIKESKSPPQKFIESQKKRAR